MKQKTAASTDIIKLQDEVVRLQNASVAIAVGGQMPKSFGFKSAPAGIAWNTTFGKDLRRGVTDLIEIPASYKINRFRDPLKTLRGIGFTAHME